jgi:hypothetical protein
MHGLGLRLNDADGAPRRSIRRRLLALALLPLGSVCRCCTRRWPNGVATYITACCHQVGPNLVGRRHY